jgi:hypothetical protein
MPLGNSMSFGQNEIQETTPGVIKEVKLRSTYRYFRVFRTKELIFDYPAILHISLKANKAPIEKGSIKLEFRHSSEGSGKSIATAHGPGPFKEEIEILQLKPYESRQIETRTRSINYIPRVLNPATLTLTVLDSKGQYKGYKTLYIDLKSLEEAKREVRNKMVFWAVILTFVMTLAYFSKDCIFPLTQEIASQFLSESTSGKRSPSLLPPGEHASALIPNRNGYEKVVGSKRESAILNPKLRQPIEKKAEPGAEVDGN